MIILKKATKLYKSNGLGIIDIDLTLPDHGLVIIKGDNGSGKSTLMSILSCSDYLDKGQYFYNNLEINRHNIDEYRRQKVSVIYQDFRLIDDLTVLDNILLAAQACGENITEEEINDILDKVGIKQYSKSLAKNLSGGEQQRLAIARALVKKDASIFADEPTGNLDSKNGESIMEILKEISKNRLVVVITHNDEYSSKYGDIIFELEDGNIISCKGDNTNIKPTQTLTSFEKTRPRIKFNTFIRLSKLSFKNKKTSLILVMALVVLMIIINFFTLFLVHPNYTQAFLTSLKSNKCNQAFSRFNNLTYDEIETLNQKLDTNLQISPVWKLDNVFVSDVASKFSKRLIFNNKIISAKDISEIDTKILYGSFPKNENEIMVPESYANYFIDKEYIQLNINSNEMYKISTIQDLLGKKVQWVDSLYIDFNTNQEPLVEYIISGIFEDYLAIDNIDFSNESQYAIDNSLASYFIVKDYKQSPFSGVNLKGYQIDEKYNEGITLDNKKYNIDMQYDLNINEVLLSQKYKDKLINKDKIGIYKDDVLIQELKIVGYYKNIDIGMIINEDTFKKLNEDNLSHYQKNHLTFNAKKYHINYYDLCKMNRIINEYFYDDFVPFEEYEDKYFIALNAEDLLTNISNINDMKVLYISIQVIILLCFILLLMILISKFIDIKFKQIKVLRILGFNYLNVLNLFLFQFLILGILEFLLGIIMTAVAMPLINLIIIPSYMKYSIFVITAENALIIGGIMLVINIIVAVIKTKQIYRKSLNETYME